jgi:hypothetical protein
MCSFTFAAIQNTSPWLKMCRMLPMEKRSHSNMEEKTLVPNPNVVTCVNRLAASGGRCRPQYASGTKEWQGDGCTHRYIYKLVEID